MRQEPTAIEDFYLMDEEPVEEEIIFRANEPAAFEEEAAAIEEPEAPAEEEGYRIRST